MVLAIFQCPGQVSLWNNVAYVTTGIWRRTRDRKVAGSIPGRGAIKSTRSTQPSIPPG